MLGSWWLFDAYQLIFGYPGENWKTLNETISLFREVKLPGRRFGIITPLPGAPLYEEAKKDGFIGDKETDKISEVKYLEFLSERGGWVAHDLFYNRTEFSDDVFFSTMYLAQNIMFIQFMKSIFSNPLHIIKNWSIYKLYLRNWWRYLEGVIKLSFKKFLIKNIMHPTNSYRFLKNCQKNFQI